MFKTKSYKVTDTTSNKTVIVKIAALMDGFIKEALQNKLYKEFKILYVHNMYQGVYLVKMANKATIINIK